MAHKLEHLIHFNGGSRLKGQTKVRASDSYTRKVLPSVVRQASLENIPGTCNPNQKINGMMLGNNPVISLGKKLRDNHLVDMNINQVINQKSFPPSTNSIRFTDFKIFLNSYSIDITRTKLGIFAP